MSANLTADQMLNYMYGYRLNGNVIDHTWYKILRRKIEKGKEGDKPTYGKPHLEAIFLLADIVYWYRPKVTKHEDGSVSLNKRFKADLLQRSYSQIEESIGMSPREAKSAMVTLEHFGVAKRVFRKIKINGVIVPNIMYIEFNPVQLKELMENCLTEMQKEREKEQEKEEEEEGLKKLQPCDVQTSYLLRSNVTPLTFKRQYTETTTQTTTYKDNVRKEASTLPLSKEIPKTTPVAKISLPSKKPDRYTKKLNPEQLKLHNKLIKYKPNAGDPLDSDTVCGWFNKKEPFTVKQVEDAFKVYLQDAIEATQRGSKINSMGACMRAALNAGRTPKNEDMDFNKEYAQRASFLHNFIEITKRYVTVICGSCVESIEFNLARAEFRRQLENKINLARLYS